MSSNLSGEIIAAPSVETRGRRRKYHADRAATSTETMRAHRDRIYDHRKSHIAVLDFETDPFDEENQSPVYPFTVCFLSDFEEHVIWDDDWRRLIDRLAEYLAELPEEYTIYAHNGGAFDYMFMIHHLTGRISFKGRSIMSAKIGRHTLRDSKHILPMKLSEWKKDDFDYSKMHRDVRDKHRDEIIEYMINDCRSLLSIVRAFIGEFGFKLSVGQAAMSKLKSIYKVARLSDATDAELRPYFFGGRVECLAGKGQFGHIPHTPTAAPVYKLYDVNSMYPHCMAAYRHPVGGHWTFRRTGGVTANTIFLTLQCRNFGAFVQRTAENETTAEIQQGEFRTTIWEYRAALELGLIDDVRIIQYVDCDQFSDFSQFSVPLYERRQKTKEQLRALKKNGVATDAPEYLAVKKDDMFLKFLLNTGYGKFAQNPRRFKDHWITKHGDPAPEGYEISSDGFPALPAIQNIALDYDIWQRPAPIRGFYNVGTAASITGAARATLLRALACAVDPIYCDTDSIICRSLSGVEIDNVKLGAWDLEDEFDEVIVAGKKSYACKTYARSDGQSDRVRVRCKGVPEGRVTWDDMAALLDEGAFRDINAKAPTIIKSGEQRYMNRRIRATATPGIHGRWQRSNDERDTA